MQRVEIDLPGQTGRELVGYPVEPESPLARGAHLPAWAQPALVVRNGAILNPRDAGDLTSGDYVYLLVAPPRVDRLDALFAANVEDPSAARIAFGELPLVGEAPAAEVAALYGLEIDGDPPATIADVFADRYHRPRPPRRPRGLRRREADRPPGRAGRPRRAGRPAPARHRRGLHPAAVAAALAAAARPRRTD